MPRPVRPWSWLAALLLPVAAAAQAPAPASADPPFWARPKPAGADCPCDTRQPAAEADKTKGWVPLSLAAVLVGGFWLLRRRRPAAEPAPRPPAPVSRPAPVLAPVSADFEFADPGSTSIELAQSEPAGESASSQAFYREIAASLRAALKREPARQDLRRKLLEIHAASGQAQDFIALAHDYLEHGTGIRDPHWAEIGAQGARLAPEHELFREWSRPRAARPLQRRRYHERRVDQGKLYSAQQQLQADFQRLARDGTFQEALRQQLADAARRPAPLAASPELSFVADGAQIFVKREDRRRYHDDVMINALGQVLLAQRLGRTRVLTATRDGVAAQAVAAAAARLGLGCTVFIGEPDLQRHYARLLGVRRLGALLRPLPAGSADAADPRRAAFEAWLEDPGQVQYISGLTAGPSPFPEMVREFLGAIGRETAEQIQQATGALPRAVVAGTADGHLGLGLLHGFLGHGSVALYCVEEPAAEAAEAPWRQTRREHRWLRDTGRVSFVAGDAHETLRVVEQFHAAGETLYTSSARSLAQARLLARGLDRRDTVVVLLTNQEGADFRSPRADW